MDLDQPHNLDNNCFDSNLLNTESNQLSSTMEHGFMKENETLMAVEEEASTNQQDNTQVKEQLVLDEMKNNDQTFQTQQESQMDEQMDSSKTAEIQENINETNDIQIDLNMGSEKNLNKEEFPVSIIDSTSEMAIAINATEEKSIKTVEMSSSLFETNESEQEATSKMTRDMEQQDLVTSTQEDIIKETIKEKLVAEMNFGNTDSQSSLIKQNETSKTTENESSTLPNQVINSVDNKKELTRQEIETSMEKALETAIVRDLLASSGVSGVSVGGGSDLDLIDSRNSNLKRNEDKELNQLVDSLINDVCNPNNVNQNDEQSVTSIQQQQLQPQQTQNADDENTDDAVADVVAAVEKAAKTAAAAAINGNSNGEHSIVNNSLSSPLTTTTPKSTKKKQPRTNTQSPAKTSTSTVSNHLNHNNNNSLNNSFGQSAANETSPSSANQKRRKKDPSAPKAPLNGYLVYFNEERATMRSKNPGMTFGDLTKEIASKWKELSTEEKQKYVNEADLDKERYNREMADYKKSDAYKQYLKENTHAKSSRNENDHTEACFNRNIPNMNGGSSNGTNGATNHPNMTWLQNEANVAGFDIPIFTEEFIEHSKNREQEMRQVKKELKELEQQNSVLNNHIENLKQSTGKIEQDIENYKNSNNQLKNNLEVFRQTILHCFKNVPLPNTQDYPTEANIDDYIMRLYSIVNMYNQNEINPNQNILNDQFYSMNRSFAIHVKSVFSQINFNSLFESLI